MPSIPKLALLVAAIAILSAPVSQERRALEPERCEPSNPSCSELVAVPDLPATSGMLRLYPVQSPFGVSVTADGRARVRLVADISALPSARSLGSFTTYIAWLYPLGMDSVVRLAPVSNGRNELGEVSLDQFRVRNSADRSGKIVMRATSPSARLMAHRDIVQPSALGAPRDEGMSALMTHDHAMHEWTMPPMPPQQGMAGMGGLVPSDAPWLPAAKAVSLHAAKPRSVIRLRSGDTLSLVAMPVRATIDGRTFTAYAFNGEIPGPLLQVRKNASIVVRFTNHLDMPSAVHWHGVRLDNSSDGVPGITQSLVAPGTSFVYHVRFPDAGVFWYHPHHREDVQQDLGMYGNIQVRPEQPDWLPRVDREEVLALDDILLGADGPVAYGTSVPTHALMGRWGNVMLVNGRSHWRSVVRRGEVVRFWFTNVASARFFNISFPGVHMTVVATDVGRFEHPSLVASAVMAPAERYAVDVRFDVVGDIPLLNRVRALDHMTGTFFAEEDTLGVVTVVPDGKSSRARHAVETRAAGSDEAYLETFRHKAPRTPDHALTLTMRTRNLPGAVSGMLWGINAPVDWNDGMAMANWSTTSHEVEWVLRDPATGKENMAIDWHVRVGDVARIRVMNDASTPHAMAHPLHVHGQRFLVITRDGVPSQNMAWKDTAVIPAGQTVDLLVEMSNPGMWMVHCHIAEHLGAGMMGVFTVTR